LGVNCPNSIDDEKLWYFSDSENEYYGVVAEVGYVSEYYSYYLYGSYDEDYPVDI